MKCDFPKLSQDCHLNLLLVILKALLNRGETYPSMGGCHPCTQWVNNSTILLNVITHTDLHLLTSIVTKQHRKIQSKQIQRWKHADPISY